MAVPGPGRASAVIRGLRRKPAANRANWCGPDPARKDGRQTTAGAAGPSETRNGRRRRAEPRGRGERGQPGRRTPQLRQVGGEFTAGVGVPEQRRVRTASRVRRAGAAAAVSRGRRWSAIAPGVGWSTRSVAGRCRSR
ncbi:hypothetical protein SALBM135S_08616 [Streptomyces alboniger]